jgi:hypothetical protein
VLLGHGFSHDKYDPGLQWASAPEGPYGWNAVIKFGEEPRWNRKMFFGSLLPEEGQIAKPARWRNYKKGRQPQGFGRVG